MKKKGFTLVELMLAVSIFSIFAVYMYKTFFDEQRFFISLHRQVDLQYNANTAMEYLTGAARNHINLTPDAADPRIIYSDASKSHILMNLTGYGNSGDIYLSVGDNTLRDGTGNTASEQGNVICGNITGVTAAIDSKNPELLTITVNLSSGRGLRKVDYSEKVSINMRN